MHKRQKFTLQLKALPVQIVHYIGVFVFPHHKNLINNEFFLWLLLQVHLFDGHLNTERRVGGLVNKRQDQFSPNAFHLHCLKPLTVMQTCQHLIC